MKFYKLADRPSLAEVEDCGFRPGEHPWVNPFRTGVIRLVAVLTGEKRPPKSDEWYLSGAIPEAYKAPNDLTTEFYILKLARVSTKLVTKLA